VRRWGWERVRATFRAGGKVSPEGHETTCLVAGHATISAVTAFPASWLW